VTEGSITAANKLTVAASSSDNTSTLSYAWYSNTTNSNTSGTPTGVTTADFSIPTTLTQAGSPYYYYVEVRGNKGETPVKSAVATVTVASQTYTVTFAATPTTGANGTLTATVDGSSISSGASVVAGKTVVFAVAPSTDYGVDYLMVDGSIVMNEDGTAPKREFADGKYEVTIQNAINVTAAFTLIASVNDLNKVVEEKIPEIVTNSITLSNSVTVRFEENVNAAVGGYTTTIWKTEMGITTTPNQNNVSSWISTNVVAAIGNSANASVSSTVTTVVATAANAPTGTTWNGTYGESFNATTVNGMSGYNYTYYLLVTINPWEYVGPFKVFIPDQNQSADYTPPTVTLTDVPKGSPTVTYKVGSVTNPTNGWTGSVAYSAAGNFVKVGDNIEIQYVGDANGAETYFRRNLDVGDNIQFVVLKKVQYQWVDGRNQWELVPTSSFVKKSDGYHLYGDADYTTASGEPKATAEASVPSGTMWGNGVVESGWTCTVQSDCYANNYSFITWVVEVQVKSNITEEQVGTFKLEQVAAGNAPIGTVLNLTATSSAVPAVSISVQPASKTTVKLGAIAGNLSVTASYSPAQPTQTLRYQWYRSATGSIANDDEPATGTGVTNATFPIPTDLSPLGTYYFYVRVSLASNPAIYKTSNVAEVEVVSPISVTPASKEFVPVVMDQSGGYVQPAAQTFEITNTTNRQVTLESPTSTNYVIGNLSPTVTVAANNGKVTFTVRPKPNLLYGTYEEEIKIFTKVNNVNVELEKVGVKFIVYPYSPCQINVSPSELDFGEAFWPYRQPAAKTVVITNIGAEKVTLSPPSGSGDYEIGPLMMIVNGSSVAMGVNDLLPKNATATFTVRPKGDLEPSAYPGSYTDNITIVAYGENGGNSSESVNAVFAVTEPLEFSMSASQLTPFDPVPSTTYTPPQAQVVTITNSGNGEIKNVSVSASADYTVTLIGALPTVFQPLSTFSFNIRPKAGLSAGNHDETIRISGKGGFDGNTDIYVNIYPTFTVAPARTISVSPADLDFGQEEEWYAQPNAKTVTVTNTSANGTAAISLTKPAPVNYEIVTPAAWPISVAAGAAAVFTVRPKADLPASVNPYDEAIIVKCGNDCASATVMASFTVNQDPTPKISVSPETISFGTVQTSYTQPGAQTVTITNTGSASVTLYQLGDYVNYDIVGLSAVTILAGRGDKTTFTIRPKAVLEVGNYDVNITISGNFDGSSKTVPVTFSVTERPVITITAHPVPTTTVTAGSVTGSLSVAASTNSSKPTSHLSYKWYRNTTDVIGVGTATQVSGATASVMPIPTNLTAAGSPYYYYAVVSGTKGEADVTSNLSTVTVNPAGRLTVTITTQPEAAVTVTAGRITGVLEVAATVSPPTPTPTVTYQWYKAVSETATAVPVAVSLTALYH